MTLVATVFLALLLSRELVLATAVVMARRKSWCSAPAAHDVDLSPPRIRVIVPIRDEPDRLIRGLLKIPIPPGSALDILHASDTSLGPKDKASLVMDYLHDAQEVDKVCIYDVDSRPTQSLRSRTHCPVVQQTSIYTVESPEAAFGFWNGVSDSQSFWALSYERLALKYLPYFYLVGHGLQIDVGLLKKFPFRRELPGEDLLLGYQLSLARIRPCLSEGYDVAYQPTSIVEYMRQSSRWFLGEVTALASAGTGVRAVYLRVFRAAGLAFWLFSPMLYTVALFNVESPILWIVAGLSLRMTAWVSIVARKKTHANANTWRLDLRLIGFFCRPLVNSMAGIYGIVRYLFSPFFASHMPKASRN